MFNPLAQDTTQMTQQTKDGLVLIIQARIARGQATPADFVRLAQLEGAI